jgi:uncharacterized protein DUF1707
MTTETGGFPSGELRVSDADRDLAIAELSEHFQTGRLTHDEFGDRSARALQARIGRELSELFTDLPGGAAPRGTSWQVGPADSWRSPDPAASPGGPGQGPLWQGPSRLERSPRCRRSGGRVVVGVVAVIAVAGLLGNVGHVGIGHGGYRWLIPLLIVMVVLRTIARRR